MKKSSSVLSALVLLLMATSLVGCKSPGRNPAGVRGSEMGSGAFAFEDIGGTAVAGDLPMGGRFAPGGTERAGLFAAVLFGYDSSQISASERAKVEVVAQELQSNPNWDVIIEGHCDERGSREYNLPLGERRAQAIRAYLIELGINSNRIQTKSFGEEQPVEMGHNESAWRLNRRGEFVLYY